VKYIPYDAGGDAMAGLLSGEAQALSTGFSEAVALAKAGEVKHHRRDRDERVPAFPDAPTMQEQGIDTTFVNWRGFFAAPGTSGGAAGQTYQALWARCYETAGMGSGPVAQRAGSTSSIPATISAPSSKRRKSRSATLMTKLGFL
jgi:hypothetical protein